MRLDVVGQLLRREQRALQVAFVLAVLVQHGFHACHIRAEAIGFAQRLLVVLGDRHHEGRHFDRIEPPEGLVEFLLTEVQRADVHGFDALRLVYRTDGG